MDELKSIFTKVGHGIKAAALAVYGAACSVFGVDNVKAFGVAAEGYLKTALGKVAMEVVSELSAQAIDGTAKRDIAFGKIKAAAEAAAIPAADSMIYLLIELAVGAIKGAFPTS